MPHSITLGIDHFGLTVNKCSEVISMLYKLGIAGICYVEGPVIDAYPGWMQEKLGAREQDSLFVHALRIKNLNLELFEYGKPSPPPQFTPPHIAGLFGLLIRSNNVESILQQLPSTVDAKLSRSSQDYCYIAHSSGLNLAFEKSNHEEVLGVIALHQNTYDDTVDDFKRVFGLKQLRKMRIFECSGVELAGQFGSHIVVLSSDGHNDRPWNSDTGGHHIAFHADNVDRSRKLLSSIDGYTPMGLPETITQGPIIGDRWNYVLSPSGLQFELINMPDGTLPYERNAEVKRSPILSQRSWK